jgi:hypothetical protein
MTFTLTRDNFLRLLITRGLISDTTIQNSPLLKTSSIITAEFDPSGRLDAINYNFNRPKLLSQPLELILTPFLPMMNGVTDVRQLFKAISGEDLRLGDQVNGVTFKQAGLLFDQANRPLPGGISRDQLVISIEVQDTLYTGKFFDSLKDYNFAVIEDVAGYSFRRFEL